MRKSHGGLLVDRSFSWICRRGERGPVILTINRAFVDRIVVAATLGRLLHHAVMCDQGVSEAPSSELRVLAPVGRRRHFVLQLMGCSRCVDAVGRGTQLARVAVALLNDGLACSFVRHVPVDRLHRLLVAAPHQGDDGASESQAVVLRGVHRGGGARRHMPVLFEWWKAWDSNPRRACTLGSFQDCCLKPLGQPSGDRECNA